MPKTIYIKGKEKYDSSKNEFFYEYEGYIVIEHSLLSIHEWESKYHKTFMGKKEKSDDELLDYIYMMTLKKSDDSVYDNLSIKNIFEIKEYMDDPMTAVYFNDEGKQGSDTITSELIYYWMIQSGIPFECQNWHINQLMSLIKVCSLKSSKPKKMSKGEIGRRNAALNAKRLAELNTRG